MKAFDKWFAVGNTPTIADSLCDVTEIAWREALKWAMKTLEHISPSDYKILEEELKEC